MPSSASSDRIQNVAGNEEPTNGIVHQMETQIIRVASAFKLSDRKEFRANVEALVGLGNTLGIFMELKKNTLTMTFSSYTGVVRVQTNGYVKCDGQGSFEEAEHLAKLVVGIFRRIGQEPAGLFEHRFIQVQATSSLPFRVHLRNLRQSYPQLVSYDYSIQKGKADIRFVDLKATISLGVSGKMNLFCSGDCDPVDYRMTNTLGAVERLCRMADSCKLPDVGKAVVTPNRQNTDLPHASLEEHNQYKWGINCVRRSERLPGVWNTPALFEEVQDRDEHVEEELGSHLSDSPLLDFLTDFVQKNGTNHWNLAACLAEAGEVEKYLLAKGEKPSIWQLFLDEIHARSYFACPPVELKVPEIIAKAPQKRKSMSVYSANSSTVKKKKPEDMEVVRRRGRPRKQPLPEEKSAEVQELKEGEDEQEVSKSISREEQAAIDGIAASIVSYQTPEEQTKEYLRWFMIFFNRPDGMSAVRLYREYLE